jgi:DNA-binding response OmpR family regulator
MSRRALIVDDEPASCELIQKVLYAAGIEGLTLTRSDQAISYLGEGRFDLIFLDLNMGAPDGIELARQIRNSKYTRTTPIILISDDRRPSALSRGFEAGASFFLYKPIDKERLLKLVRATQGRMEHERRRTRRIPLCSKVRLRFGTDEVDGETINVSLNGILVRTQRTAPPGSSVHVSLVLREGMSPIEGRGSVARIASPNQMGIQLDRLTAHESERLQEFLLPMISTD